MASATATRRAERAAETPRPPAFPDPGNGDEPQRRTRRTLSPLTLRILAVNVLALAILVGGLLYLGRYQERLVDAELEALATEARIFASALGEGAVRREETDAAQEVYVLQPELARQMVRRLVETTETRTRLFAADGRALSDSRVLTGSPGSIQIEDLPPPPSGNVVSRLFVHAYDRAVDVVPSRSAFPVYGDQTGPGTPLQALVERALGGEVAPAVWRVRADDDRSGLMLTVAVPVQRYKQVLGAVLLSRTGAGIDTAVRTVRLDILRVFAVALAVTVLLSFYLASAIARPIARLALAADRLRLGQGRPAEIPDFSRRGDEIGDLSGALRALTEAQRVRMDAIERFAADVAHEIKNPLSSLRSAVETIGRVEDPGRRARLMAVIADDVQRLDRLISDISNASRLDAELSREEPEPVDIGAMLTMLADLHDATGGAACGGPPPPRMVVERVPGDDLTVPGLEGRLTQVFENLIANALSFSPPGGLVRLAARRAGDTVEVVVSDEGPGIPAGKERAIFDRFYTERPEGEKFGTHSGLGLSIARRIVDAHRGSIAAHNRRAPDGRVLGAVFVVRLPRH